jgi:hypothetical protein
MFVSFMMLDVDILFSAFDVLHPAKGCSSVSIEQEK